MTIYALSVLSGIYNQEQEQVPQSSLNLVAKQINIACNINNSYETSSPLV